MEDLGKYLQSLNYGDDNFILIIDNSRVHLALEDIETALKYRIHLVSLIKNTTGETQPLDKVIFGPFKRELEVQKELVIYKDGMNGTIYKLQKRDLVKCSTLAMRKVDTPENRAAAFRSTGLWPCDPHIFDQKFAVLRSSSSSSAVPSNSPSPAPSLVNVQEKPDVSTRDLAG